MSDAQQQPMIDIRNVSKWYGPVQVLHDCNVQIQKQDVVVVCGPSDTARRTARRWAVTWSPCRRRRASFSTVMSGGTPGA